MERISPANNMVLNFYGSLVQANLEAGPPSSIISIERHGLEREYSIGEIKDGSARIRKTDDVAFSFDDDSIIIFRPDGETLSIDGLLQSDYDKVRPIAGSMNNKPPRRRRTRRKGTRKFITNQIKNYFNVCPSIILNSYQVRDKIGRNLAYTQDTLKRLVEENFLGRIIEPGSKRTFLYYLQQGTAQLPKPMTREERIKSDRNDTKTQIERHFTENPSGRITTKEFVKSSKRSPSVIRSVFRKLIAADFITMTKDENDARIRYYHRNGVDINLNS